ncbi:hypothetical protein ACQBAT_01310 [Ornithinimicrobium sp. Y1847]|uniref:Dph6-related ATP pyrophosphatase n=1 Tax=Ornithinimicrobium sp. Y1847 TaxID=3405419 RepID=UPI003B67F57F
MSPPTAPTRVALFWSGGKDSALALHRLSRRSDVDVVELVTMLEEDRAVSTVHEIPLDLLGVQARCLGLSLRTVQVGANLEGYADRMVDLAAQLSAAGVGAVAFGDLDRSGARGHRERAFAGGDVRVLEPLSGMGSRQAVEEFLSTGARAVVVAVDAAFLDQALLGRRLDRSFVDGLPPDTDPAGELGEYHSFVHDGPWFSQPVPFVLSPVREVVRTVGTTNGPQEFRTWLAAPERVPGRAGGACAVHR